MLIPEKYSKNGLCLPVLGLGTWLIGGMFSRDPGYDESADIESIRRAIELGITHIDTAEMYAEGFTEEIVCKGIQTFERESLFIATKVWETNLKYEDVIRSVKMSLKRLGTKYIDLYYIHKPNILVDIQETMKAMDRLVDDGIVRHIGLSNFTAERIHMAQKYTKHKISVVQAHYNLIYREPEAKDLVKYCIDNDILLVAWRPLECGYLSNTRVPIMQEISTKNNMTYSQIALNWLISQRNVVTISTMRTSKHLRENLDALKMQLSASDLTRLSADFPEKKMISNAVPLS